MANKLAFDGRNVPFIGWSPAAFHFRRLANQFADQNTSVLFLGDAGVGKMTMAKVWQLVGRNKKQIFNLDQDNCDIKKACIGVTNRPLPEGTSYICLGGSESTRALPPQGNAVLPERVAGYFPFRVYLPPLHLRKADILALIHYYVKYFLPSELGVTYSYISQAVLDRLKDHFPWKENARGLKEGLKINAIDQMSSFALLENLDVFDLGTLCDSPKWPGYVVEETGPILEISKPEPVFASAIEKGLVPNTSLWRSSHSVRVSKVPGSGKVWKPPISIDDLPDCAVGWWCSEAINMICSFNGWLVNQSNPDVSSFLNLSIQEYVNDRKMVWSGNELKELTQTDIDVLCEFLLNRELEGTTFGALKEGLAVSFDTSIIAAIDELDAVESNVLEIERWSQIAIAIYVDTKHMLTRYFVFQPAPAFGDKVYLRKRAAELHIGGEIGPRILSCFAESEDGMIVSKEALFAAIYAKDSKGNRLDKHAVEKLTKGKSITRLLNGATSELSERLREQIKCKEKKPFQGKGDTFYRFGIKVGIIVKEDDGRLRFKRDVR